MNPNRDTETIGESNSPAAGPAGAVRVDTTIEPARIGTSWIEQLQRAALVLRRLLIPTPMVKAGMFFLADDAAEVVSVLARLGVCQIDRVPGELEDYFTPYFPEQFRDAFRRLRERYEPLAQRWELTGKGRLSSVEPHVPTVSEMDRLARLLDQLSAQVNDIAQRTKQLETRQVELDHFGEYVRVLSDLDMDMKDLADLRFLHLRVGTVPMENVDRLRESAELGEDLVFGLGARRDRAHVMVVGAGGFTPDLEGLLAKAHFDRIDPSASILAEGTDNIHVRLEAEVDAVQAELDELKNDENRLRDSSQEHVLESAQVVAHAAVFVQCDGAMEGRKPVAFLSGWVPDEKLPELEQSLARDVANPVALIHEPAAGGAGEQQPPSEMVVPVIFRPGVELVSLYGPPGYDEINPALFLAVTTPLMFGMMFGDVGHGLLLGIAAIACRRWLRQWVPVVLSCSVGSVVFGLLYGSVFGVEHWLPALWLSPMDEPMILLEIALWAGVGFVFVTFFLKAFSLSVQGRWHEALFSFQAIAGAIFYFGAVFVFRSLYLGKTVSLPALGLALGGLLLTGIHSGQQLRMNGRSAVAELASEYFHGILTLFTNTLSFLPPSCLCTSPWGTVDGIVFACRNNSANSHGLGLSDPGAGNRIDGDPRT